MELDEARERARRVAYLNAFLCFTDEHGPGPAVAVKDLIDVRGLPTTGGGVILPRTPAAADAPVITRIRAGGCGVVGKTNLHEWAYGASSRNPHYGDVQNPRLPGRNAGGSSSGSAAAVAAGLCDWAIGTDTAGSVRIPASLCGIVGFRPSYGTVPMAKVIPLARSLDTVGALAPTVTAAAEAVALMAGWSVPFHAPAASAGTLRLARPAGWVTELDEPTDRAWAEVGSRIPRLAEVTLPDRELLAQTAVTIQSGEAAAFHRDWMRTGPERYGADVRAKLEAALEVRAADYVRACDDRHALTEAVEQVLAGLDALVLPATAVTAPPLDGPEHRAELTRFTRPFSLTGHPCIVIPAPTPAAGPPVGIQLVGKAGSDARLAEVAAVLERSWFLSPAAGDADRRLRPYFWRRRNHMDSIEAFFAELSRQPHVTTFEGEKATVRFEALTGNTIERWHVTVADGAVSVTRQNEAADSVVRVHRRDLEAMVTGQLNAQAAVLRGLVDAQGKLAALMMFQRCLPGPPGSTGKVAPISGKTVMTWRRP